MILYHVTSRARLESVLAWGLRVGSERHLTVAGTWANVVYGEQPVFLASAPWLQDGADRVLLAVDASGLELCADLPALVDQGAYLDEDGQGLWWEEGQTPASLLPFEDPLSGVVSYADLLAGGAATQAAIALTGSCAARRSIAPARIQRASWPGS